MQCATAVLGQQPDAALYHVPQLAPHLVQDRHDRQSNCLKLLRQRDGLPLGLATSQVVHVNGDAAEASKLAVTRDRRQGGHRWAIRRNPISDRDQTFLPQIANNLAVDAVIRHRLAEQVAVTGRRLRQRRP